MKELLIESIRTDGGVQSRERINEEYVAELAELMKSGKKLPEVIVYMDGTDIWMADGFHRILAHCRNGVRTIKCDVRKGTKEDAMWASCAANKDHGLRRTHGDLEKSIKMAIELKPSAAQTVIAEHVGCTQGRISQVIKINSLTRPEKVTGNDGKEYPAKRIPPPPSGKTPTKPMIPPPKPPTPEKRTKQSELQKDEVGADIPEEIQPLFDRGHEVKALLQKITEIRTALNRAKEDGDALYGDCHFQSVEAALSTAYTDLKATIPYAVCPWCKGVMPENCRGCGKRGVLGQFKWDTVVPRNLKP